MRSAEKHLDTFWEIVDQHFSRHTGKTGYSTIEKIIRDRKLTRTPEWREPKHLVATTDKDSEKMTTSLLLTTLQERTERTVASDKITSTKEKQKTRAAKIAPPLTVQENCSGGTSNDATPITIYKVSKRDYRVFAMLFRLPHEEGVPGELPWIDFLHAMSSLGFAVQKLDGSAWLFSPALEPLNRSIIFHEPHPSSKIPFVIARRYGGRLTRAFGWKAENFIRA